VLDYLNRADRNKHRELEKKIDAHQVNSPGAPPRAMVLADSETPHQPRVFIRGNHARPGKEVSRQFLLVLSSDSRKPFTQGSGRLELAQAIVSPENPLTRRVFANRVWMHHFGEPLVSTPSDFGMRCEPPLHRELLDYLAWYFGQHGWSIKSLHREMMLSATYRQSSKNSAVGMEHDPENRLYWRMNRRRLEFEALRDSLLFAAGKLDLALGGRPVPVTAPPYQGRRTVYAFIDRQDLPNLLRVFDFASPDQSQAKRPQTTVPQQALFMMNSPFVTLQAGTLAEMIERQAVQDPTQRIEWLYQRVFARSPTKDETTLGIRFIESLAKQKPADDVLPPWQQYAQLLLMTNEFSFVD
jgi:hypothetical protein